MAALTEKWVLHGASQSLMSVLPGPTITDDIDELSDLDTSTVYEKEKQSWVSNNAYNLVMINDVELGSNVIGSHVVYRRKMDGTLIARIVSWSRKDSEKDDIRGDVPSLDLDFMGLLLSLTSSLTSENG